jgi:taurine dioxygenase
MIISIEPTGQACGAVVRGIDLSKPQDEDTIAQLRNAWIEHHVMILPDQTLSDTDLERVTQYFGVFGKEPFFEPIDGNDHVVAVTRRADEKAPVFAETWHSDWSFLPEPPIGTFLYSLTIPPIGGNTGFINQAKALKEMPSGLRKKLDGLTALHSARGGYAPDGLYGDKETESDRSMRIKFSDEAYDVYKHPLIKVHPESGEETLHGCFGYIIGFDGVGEEESKSLLGELYQWQTQEAFQYTHEWQEGMLVLWDNRAVLHRANGGYDGYDRELHRTTVYADQNRFLVPA